MQLVGFVSENDMVGNDVGADEVQFYSLLQFVVQSVLNLQIYIFFLFWTK